MRKELSILFIITLLLGLAPFFLHNNLVVMQILIMVLIYAVVASGWDLMMGYAGIFTFGQIAFMAIGAYSSAILSMQLGISPWLSMLAGGTIAMVIGFIVGLSCLNLEGDYVALITFAIQLLLGPFLLSDMGKAIGTGGTSGLILIPSLSIGGYTFNALELAPWFYVALGIFIISHLIIYRIIFSHWGMAFVALRDNKDFAKSLGVNDFKYKMLVFVVSAFLTGVIGGFYAHYTGVLSVRLINGLDLFLMLIIIQVVGGQGLFPGAVIGTLIITFINQALQGLDSYRPIILGALIILLVILFPKGIMGFFSHSSGTSVSEKTSNNIWQSIRKRILRVKDREI